MRYLVVVLPGIGGSVLADAEGTVWDAGVGDIAGLLFDSGRLSLSTNPHLRPVGLVTSKRLLPGWTVVRGYEGLLDRLDALPGAIVDRGVEGQRVADANVVAFAYDFRRSVAEAADLLDAEVKVRLEALGLTGEDKRVVLVAHSMGGLVARHWLGVRGTGKDGERREAAWRLCRTLITLGTPHRGAPKALNTLVNGVGKGPFQFRKATEVLRGWPGVYELLPRYRAILDRSVDPQVPVARYPHELAQLGQRAIDAYRMHETIEDAWNDMPRGGPEVAPLVGWSHRTLSAAFLDRNGLRVEKVNPAWIDLSGREQDFGDGTVPAFSALPIEMSGTALSTFKVQERHGELAGVPAVIDWVRDAIGLAPLDAIRGNETKDRVIGLELDEFYEPETPFQVRVDVRNVDAADVDGVWVTIKGGRRPPIEQRASLDGDGFVVEVDGLPVGMYDLTIDATGIPNADDQRIHDSFAVVTGQEDEVGS